MIARPLAHHTPWPNRATDPVVAAELAVERHPSAIPALAVPEFLMEQHSVWRACWHGTGGTKATAERMAAVVARMQREEAGR